MTCQARQYSDQMMYGACGLQWDVNDPEPPHCSVVNGPGRASGVPPSWCRDAVSEPTPEQVAAEHGITPPYLKTAARAFDALRDRKVVLNGRKGPTTIPTAARFRDKTEGRFRVVLVDRETGIQGVGYGETVTDATAEAGRDMAKRSVSDD